MRRSRPSDRDKVAEPFWGEPEAGVQFWAGHTYGGNPVACAIGEAAVRYLLEHDLTGNADRVGAYLAERLWEIAGRRAVVAEVRGVGVAARDRLSGAGRQGGLRGSPAARITAPSRHDWVGVAPPLCTTTDEADEIASILDAAIADVTG
ncbi:MAG: hypothetical protein KatS3mg059_1073 [Thermomicrobiales bacterium]|nr:MAG: hypothetical protein KatS3mg059_1073 [Thermomicrobiales bacterium]